MYSELLSVSLGSIHSLNKLLLRRVPLHADFQCRMPFPEEAVELSILNSQDVSGLGRRERPKIHVSTPRGSVLVHYRYAYPMPGGDSLTYAYLTSDNAFPYSAATEYSPVQTHTAVADQYFETVRRSSPTQPEKSLMVALLLDAVTCFQNNIFAKTRRAKSIFKDAEDWIFSDDEKWLFSYRNVCQALDIDFAWLRQDLMEWKRRKLKEHSKLALHN